ncbi:MAG: heme exporter protein CcmB [Acidobacteriota bacterium]|jgi:heme exporter protein B|nr:heme exporter protein CcmB [Acidobacteriota bacterium]
MGNAAKIWAIFRKDLLIELRTKSAINSMLFFGVVTLLVFNFALRSLESSLRSALPGILWASFAFAGTLGLNRMFASEKENSCLQGLLMIPADRGVLYLGKMLAGSVFMLLAEVVIFVFSLIFFNVTVWGEIPLLALTFLLGTFGFMAVGTLLSAIAVNTKLREVLLPLLLFPVILPILINAVEATGIILGGSEYSALKLPLSVMAVFTLVFGTIAWLLFEYVLED